MDASSLTSIWLQDKSTLYLLNVQNPIFDYPFDKYTMEFGIKALLVDRANDFMTFYEKTLSDGRTYIQQGDDINRAVQNAISVTPLQAGVTLYPHHHGWIAGVNTADNEGTVEVVVVFERSLAVRVMVIFIMTLMWSSAICVLLAALSYLRNRDDTSYDVPALAVGLLFAMPFVRDVMPDVPTVGISVDFLSYYWVLFIIVIATVLSLSTTLYRMNKKSLEEENVKGYRWGHTFSEEKGRGRGRGSNKGSARGSFGSGENGSNNRGGAGDQSDGGQEEEAIDEGCDIVPGEEGRSCMPRGDSRV
uniref:Uncharacterized protein n=1 Tax=Chromera velia CCMP2878 TaxID=1169474 RepID=A0A0G4HEP9_9ALVE|eukprot:Cvel_26826.t1-p1 / transcript=Cvel_26826.t1 / gene=Cvel_26826 / organism=Chromera_velia_CCMP2878 / gene_product=hypothetical protein / transcript_product=hypothetical protein / location=Cvel_scaffold3250:14087-18107(-) / protein_length=303 / sequence_SO=supercontig / SO=protein_coding / is_pseudo=false